MSSCTQTQRAIAEAVALEVLSDEHQEHAEQCEACGEALRRYRRLAVMTTRTRRALEAAGDLSPQSWVRIRGAVDAAGPRRPRPWLAWGLALAVGVAAIALVAARIGQGDDGAPVRVYAHALGRIDAVPSAPALAAPVVVAPVLAAVEGGQALAVAAGDVLEAGAVARTLDAFGRHHITLEAGTEVRVGSWTPTKMVLEVVAGRVACDVERAADEDVFEVHSGDVSVRVLGTYFSVERSSEGAILVAVTRGRVGVFERGELVREVAAGESGAFGEPPIEARVEEQPARRLSGDPVVRRGPRVIQINVPDQRMEPRASDGGWSSSGALKAIVKAIDDGKCPAAMKALNALVTGSRGTPVPASEVAKLRARCVVVAPK